MTSKFDQIRPYDNADLPKVLKSLLNNSEFINTLVKFQFSNWPAFTYPIFALFIKRFIIKKTAKLKTLSDFQKLVQPYIKRMIKTTTAGLSISGLDTLDLSKPCLFISNHRDIALDPALVNWALHTHGQDTVRIAVGDNLLSKDWVADLIRLNKCFVVQRSVEGRREKLAAAKLLSEYMQYSLQTDHQHLWIAQREGRAKDGIDVTNPAIISMLALNKPKTETFGNYIQDLRIVPVSISYEFDPCDVSKAKELYQAEQEGGYDKPDNEDIRSIVNGITGQKGRVHLHFGKLLNNEFTNAKEVANSINHQILDGYKTFSTSQVALDILNTKQVKDNLSNSTFSLPDIEQHKNENYLKAYEYLQKRLAMLAQQEQSKLLTMYANPLLRD